MDQQAAVVNKFTAWLHIYAPVFFFFLQCCALPKLITSQKLTGTRLMYLSVWELLCTWVLLPCF